MWHKVHNSDALGPGSSPGGHTKSASVEPKAQPYATVPSSSLGGRTKNTALQAVFFVCLFLGCYVIIKL